MDSPGDDGDFRMDPAGEDSDFRMEPAGDDRDIRMDPPGDDMDIRMNPPGDDGDSQMNPPGDDMDIKMNPPGIDMDIRMNPPGDDKVIKMNTPGVDKASAGEHPKLVDATKPGTSSHRRRREATVYDAVAGKVWASQGGLDEDAEGRGWMTRRNSRRRPMAPDEVLFRRKDAPERYAERDVYRAHERRLAHGGRGVLPDSDALKAVHSYASRFYGALAARGGGRNVDEGSMDETALLAFGVLLEEAAREVLAGRVDVVFAEGPDADAAAAAAAAAAHGGGDTSAWTGTTAAARTRRARATTTAAAAAVAGRREAKRRRVEEEGEGERG